MSNEQLLRDLDFVSALIDRDLSDCVAALDKGADPNGDIDGDGRTMLVRAIENRFADGVRLLLDRGAFIDGPPLRRAVPLEVAVKHDLAILRLLLERGANVDIPNRNGRLTALHTAAEQPDAAPLELLLEQGANPNIRDGFGKTPLHYAAVNRKPNAVEIVRRLMEAGADPTLTRLDSKSALTPFQNAVYYGRQATVRYLLEECSEDPEQRTAEGKPLLELAAEGPMRQMIRAAITAKTVVFRTGESTESAARPLRKLGLDPL
jgi:ankyrin repeat protein